MKRHHALRLVAAAALATVAAVITVRLARAEPCRVTAAGDHVQVEDYSRWEERYGLRTIVGACVADPHNQGLDHEAIECTVSSNTLGTRAYCFARRESGAEYICSTRDPDMIRMFRGVGPGAEVAFGFTAGGECVGGNVFVGSDSEPMRPVLPRE